MGQKNDKFNIKKRKLAIKIGRNIKRARISCGLTQEKLARKLKTHQPSIARVENGSYLPSIEFLLRVSETLNLDLRAPEIQYGLSHVNIGVKVYEATTSQSAGFLNNYWSTRAVDNKPSPFVVPKLTEDVKRENIEDLLMEI